MYDEQLERLTDDDGDDGQVAIVAVKRSGMRREHVHINNDVAEEGEIVAANLSNGN